MLYERLEKLYKKNSVLAQEFPLQEYYSLLRSFMTKEVSLGAEFLSPYRFALSYGIAPKQSLRFFLGLADDEDVIQQYYKYQCEECDTINIIKDEADLFEFKCKRCGFEDHLVKAEYLSEVKLLFKINDDLLKEFISNLKELPLTDVQKVSANSDEGSYEEFSLSTYEEVANEGGRSISKKSERLEEYRRAFHRY